MSELSTRVQELLAALQGRAGTSPLHTNEAVFPEPLDMEPQHGHWDAAPPRSPATAAHAGPDTSQLSGKAALLSKLAASLSAAGGLGRREPATQSGHGQLVRVYPGSPLGVGTTAPGGSPLAAGRPVSSGGATPAWEQLQGLLAMAAPQQQPQQQQHQHHYQQPQAPLPRAVQGMGGNSVTRLLGTALDEQMLQPPEYQDQGPSITQEELSVLKRLLQMAPAPPTRPALQPQQAQPQPLPPMLPPDIIAKLKDWLAESGSPSSTLGAGAAGAGGGGAMFPPAEVPRQAGLHIPAAMAGPPDDPAGGSIAALLLDSVLRKRSGRDPSTPLEVPIICNGNRGTFNVETQLMTCGCPECKERAGREGVPAITHTPTEFERHSGMAASKKWKYTVRVLTPRGTVTLGQWLEGHGIQSKYTRSTRPRPPRGMPAAGTALSPSYGGTADGMAQHGGLSTARRGGATSEAGTASGSDGEHELRQARRAPSVSGPSPIPATGFVSTFIPATAPPGQDPGASPASRHSSPEPTRNRARPWVDPRGARAALRTKQTARRTCDYNNTRQRTGQTSGEEEEDEEFEDEQERQPSEVPELPHLPAPLLRELQRQAQQQHSGGAAGQRGAPGEPGAVGGTAAGWREGVPTGGKERALAELMGGGAAAGPDPQLKLEDVFDSSCHGLGVAGQGPAGAQQQQRQQQASQSLQQHSPFAGATTSAPLRPGSGPGPPPGTSLHGAPGQAPLANQALPGSSSRVLDPGWPADGGSPLLPRVLSVGLARPAGLPALHLGPRRAASLEHPELLSPTGKPWMSQEMHVDQLRRVGSRYQATIPRLDPRGPRGQESSDPRAGSPAPPEAEALASAAGPEKLAADLMPRDAVADLWLLELDAGTRELPGGAAAAGPLERGQRQRRKPQWMRHTVDPNEVLGGRPLRAWEEEGGTPGRRGDSDAHDRSGKRPRSGSEAKRHPASYEADMAITQGRRPDITDWRVLDDGQLAMTVQLGGVTWHGLLPAPPLTARKQQPAAGGKASVEGSAYESPGATDRAAGSLQQPDDTTSRLKGKEFQLQPNGLEGESERNMQAERRAVADAEFQRLELQGPPEGTKCALCRLIDVDDVPEEDVGPGGRAQVGLGGLILVRVSAVSNAWVHEQCAAWSPEVAENILGSGQLDSLKDAVRRGRMIRCRVCGEKGATLGCHKATCRSSYHLHCARRQRCLLQVEPYRVACPNHVDDVPDVDPDWQAQAQEASEWEEAREKRGAAGHAGDLLRRLAEVSSLQAEQDVGAIHSSRPGATPTKRHSAAAGAGAAKASKGAQQQQQQPAQVKEEAGTAAEAYDQELLQYLGGTVGSSKWRPGRCSVCVVQRKGKCGTESAPKRCLRRQAIARNPALAKVLLPDAVSPTSDAGPRSPLSSGGLQATSTGTARLGSPAGPSAAAAAGPTVFASPTGGVRTAERAGASPFRQPAAAAAPPPGSTSLAARRELLAGQAAASPPAAAAAADPAVQGAGRWAVPSAAPDQPDAAVAQDAHKGRPSHLLEGSGPDAAGQTDTDWLERKSSQEATLRWVLSAVRPGASPEEIAELSRREALGVPPPPGGLENHGIGSTATAPEQQQQQQQTHGSLAAAQIHVATPTAGEAHEHRDGTGLAGPAPPREGAVAASPWLGVNDATRASEATGTSAAAAHVAVGRLGSDPTMGVASGVKRPRAEANEEGGEGPESLQQRGDSSEAAASEAGRDGGRGRAPLGAGLFGLIPKRPRS